ncbi:unnamed protein product [Rotaria sp. Silwood2]|nr:unnamed protein product [Rotaria sp. Silwood2]
MPKSKSKLKKSTITSTTPVVKLSKELESSKCNCSSPRQDCSTEKLQVFQQSNSQSSSSLLPSKLKSRKSSRKLCYSNILSELFIMNNNNKLNEQKGQIYSTPVAKSIVLAKHETFANQILKTFDKIDDLPYCFTKTNLQTQMKYRMISLIADPFSDQVRRKKMKKVREIMNQEF